MTPAKPEPRIVRSEVAEPACVKCKRVIPGHETCPYDGGAMKLRTFVSEVLVYAEPLR